MKTGVLILIDALDSAGGGEILAVNIAVRLQESRHYRPVVCATRSGGDLEERLRDKNIPYFLLQRTRSYQFPSFSFLKRIIREQGITVIHAHKAGSNLWGGIVGRVNKVKAIVSHVHGRSLFCKTFTIEGLVARLSHKLITVSESEKVRLIEDEGISPSKVVTIYNGIDLANYKIKADPHAKNRLGLKINSPVVGISAALRPEKNHKMFLLAAKEILKAQKGVYFLIIGDGPRRKELEDFASDLGISNNCLFTGFIKNLPDVLSVVDVGVLCSNIEALPLTLLEYMASAKPIVATSVGGVPEVIQDGINGFLIGPDDHHALAQRIQLLLNDKNLATEMGTHGLSILKQKFAENIMMERIEGLYSEILSTSRHWKSRQLLKRPTNAWPSR